MTDALIKLSGVSKAYRIWHSPSARLNSIVHHCAKSVIPALWERCTIAQQRCFHDFYALRDISFEVSRGESVGIIGRNGSGKSTLLQILAGTLSPSAGCVEVNGRIAALLELGAGFNPEFSGRDNVRLNAAILGLSDAQIEARMEEIVAFADIGEFLDQPVKTYSSGMLVRLAFAVQVAVEPEILIIDEALAVGDMFFQAKCYAHLEKLRARGVTLLFVSHSLSAVRSICSRALLIEDGRCLMDGPVDVVTDLYCERNLHPSGSAKSDCIDGDASPQVSNLQPPFAKRSTGRTGAGKARYIECITTQFGRETDCLVHGSRAAVVADLKILTDLNDTSEAGILVRTPEGIDLFAVNSYFHQLEIPAQNAGTILRVTFEFDVCLAPGNYNIALGLRSPVQGEYMDKVFGAATFSVVTRDGSFVPALLRIPSKVSFQCLPS